MEGSQEDGRLRNEVSVTQFHASSPKPDREIEIFHHHHATFPSVNGIGVKLAAHSRGRRGKKMGGKKEFIITPIEGMGAPP